MVFRLPLFTAALQDWVLRRPAARQALMAGFVIAFIWIVGQSWEQLLTGHDLFGYARAGDGALTGPFYRERAGPSLLAVFFPSVLPAVMRLFEQRSRKFGLMMCRERGNDRQNVAFGKVGRREQLPPCDRSLAGVSEG